MRGEPCSVPATEGRPCWMHRVACKCNALSRLLEPEEYEGVETKYRSLLKKAKGGFNEVEIYGRMLLPCRAGKTAVRKSIRRPNRPPVSEEVRKRELSKMIGMGFQDIGPKIYFHNDSVVVMEAFEGSFHRLMKRPDLQIVDRELVKMFQRMGNRAIVNLDIKTDNMVYKVVGGKYVVRMIDFDPQFCHQVRCLRLNPLQTRHLVEYTNMVLFLAHIYYRYGGKTPLALGWHALHRRLQTLDRKLHGKDIIPCLNDWKVDKVMHYFRHVGWRGGAFDLLDWFSLKLARGQPIKGIVRDVTHLDSVESPILISSTSRPKVQQRAITVASR